MSSPTFTWIVGLPACSPGASADALLVNAAEATMAAEAARIRNPLRDKFPSPSSDGAPGDPPGRRARLVRRLESSHASRKGQQLTPRWKGSSVAAPPLNVLTVMLVAAAPLVIVTLPGSGVSVLTAASVAE